MFWLRLVWSYFLPLRASELSAKRNGEAHDVYCCVLEGDVAFFIGRGQLRENERRWADTVEAHMRG